jgi:hypothetical protein
MIDGRWAMGDDRMSHGRWQPISWSLVGVLLAPGYPVAALDGAHFVETIRTEALTKVGTAELRRLVARDSRFSVTLHGDTLLVSADSVSLTEVADGHSRTIDTDGFVGGRYRLGLDAAGVATIWQRPFIPDDIADVSDLSRAMDDFFPPLPPAMAPGDAASDAAGRRWQRLADSSGSQRFRWSAQVSRDTAQVANDTVAVLIEESTHEESALAWSSSRGPLAWTRQIESNVSTRLRGRTIRATINQKIDVRRSR